MRRANAVVALALGLMAGPLAASADDGPTALTCEFKEGASWSYDKGTFKSKEPSPLTFDIESIDLDAQTAVLRASPRATPGTLRIVRAINANHFLEAVNEGFLNLTTVYDKDTTTGLYPAVHSRHFGLLGEPDFRPVRGNLPGEIEPPLAGASLWIARHRAAHGLGLRCIIRSGRARRLKPGVTL